MAGVVPESSPNPTAPSRGLGLQVVQGTAPCPEVHAPLPRFCCRGLGACRGASGAPRARGGAPNCLDSTRRATGLGVASSPRTRGGRQRPFAKWFPSSRQSRLWPVLSPSAAATAGWVRLVMEQRVARLQVPPRTKAMPATPARTLRVFLASMKMLGSPGDPKPRGVGCFDSDLPWGFPSILWPFRHFGAVGRPGGD